MKPQAQKRAKRDKYQFISNEKRQKVILFVDEYKMPINEVCRVLSIKYTTARSILNAFKKQGRTVRYERMHND
jgi:hypothetical protein